jgi:hypothetical protein
LIRVLSEREAWKETLAHICAMRQWMMQAEQIFDGSWAATQEEITQASVGERLEHWLERLQIYVSTLEPSQELFPGLCPLLSTLSHLRPHLMCCYDVQGLPRTNNDLERCIRAIKTRYRRICGRKNWNAYVLHYGSCVAYYEWWSTQPQGGEHLEARMQHQEQLDRFRFQHHRENFLAALEAQWLAPGCT